MTIELEFYGGSTIEATIADILALDIPKKTKATEIAYLYKAVNPRVNIDLNVRNLIKMMEDFEREQ